MNEAERGMARRALKPRFGICRSSWRADRIDLNYEQGLFRLGMAHVRLKQYPQAAQVFRRLLENPSDYTGKAAVWLAKVYLRRDQGRRLLKFRDSVPPGLSVDERARIQWLSGVWAEGENAIRQAVAGL